MKLQDKYTIVRHSIPFHFDSTRTSVDIQKLSILGLLSLRIQAQLIQKSRSQPLAACFILYFAAIGQHLHTICTIPLRLKCLHQECIAVTGEWSHHLLSFHLVHPSIQAICSNVSSRALSAHTFDDWIVTLNLAHIMVFLIDDGIDLKDKDRRRDQSISKRPL